MYYRYLVKYFIISIGINIIVLVNFTILKKYTFSTIGGIQKTCDNFDTLELNHTLM